MQALIPFPNIDPILYTIEIGSFSFPIRWYALAYIAGLLLAWRWIVMLLRRPALWRNNTAPMTPQQPEDLFTWAIFGVILGGRLGFVLFYNFSYYMENPGQILRVWEGGMSFHGGFIGVIIAGLLWSKRHNLPALSVGDAIASGAPFGLFFGRIANFINAELWGRPTAQDWGVIFPGYDAQTCPIWWTQSICARHPSQLYEAALEGIVLFAVMCWVIFRRGWLKKPGALIGVFFFGYGVARTIVEGFRQGDGQFVTQNNPWGHVIRFGTEINSLGLSMGQILSIPMIAIGLVLIWRAHKA